MSLCIASNGGSVMQPNHAATPSWQTPSQLHSPSIGRRLVAVLGLAAVGSACIVLSIYASPGQAIQKVATPTTGVTLPEPVVVTAPDAPSQKWIAAAPGRVEPRT